MSAYDEVPYPTCAVAHAHPDRLAAVAALSGLRPAPPEGCRVLEIGCGAGGNLLSLAAGLPGARCVGVDASATALAEATALRDELGLGDRVTLLQADVGLEEAGLDGPSEEPFDYVLCQGTFSWVSPAAQEAILRLIRARLAPQGVAYLNTNAMPGWQARLGLRELLRLHAAPSAAPATRIAEARALLAGLAEDLGPPPIADAAARLLRAEVDGLAAVSDAYLFHEYLEGENRPLYFRELVAQVRAADLAYLGEVGFEDIVRPLLPERLRPGLTRDAEDFVRLEQREDFLIGRAYRQSLLCLPAALPAAPARPDLSGLHAACRIAPRDEARDLRSSIPEGFEFTTEGTQRRTVADPLLKAAVVALSARWPASAPVADLLAELPSAAGEPPQARQARLEAGLLELFAAGVLRLAPRAAPLVTEVSATPLACAAARAQARRGPLATNLLHQVVALDPVDRLLVMALDGTRDHAGLAARLVEATREGLLSVSVDGEEVTDAGRLGQIYAEALPERLTALAARGLLVS